MNMSEMAAEKGPNDHIYSPNDWERLLTNKFVPGQVSIGSDGPAGRIGIGREGTYLSTTELFVWPQIITHTHQHIDSLPAHERSSVIAHLVIEGEGFIKQNNSHIQFRAGDISFRNLIQPSQVVFETPCHFLALKLPSSMMNRHGAGGLNQRAPAPRVVQNATPFSCLTHQLLTPRPQGHIADKALCITNTYMALALPWMFVAAYHEVEVVNESAQAHNELRWGQILNYLDIHIFDAEASRSSACASAIGISERYLHKLFAHRGLKYSRLVLERRLVAAKSMLSCSNFFKDSIGLIAYQSGFKSQAHFSRVFRAHYGLSPQQYRFATKHPGSRVTP